MTGQNEGLEAAVDAIQRAVSNVLIVHDDGTAVVPVDDLNAAIETGVALIAAGLVPGCTLTAHTEKGEVVAWRIEDLILPAVSITEDANYARRKAEYRFEGEPTARVTPLYAAPPPAPAGEVLDAVARYMKATYGVSWGLDNPIDRARILATLSPTEAP